MIDSISTTSAHQSEPTPQVKKLSITEAIKSILPILSQLTVFVIIGGFVVVHSYLAKITDLFTYNLSVNQYIAAGISLIFYVPIFIIVQLIKSFGDALLLAGAILLAPLVYVIFYVIRDRQPDKKFTKSIEEALNHFGQFLLKIQPFQRVYNYFTVISLIFFAILTGLLYGQTYYSSVPRWLGGGQSASVVLIFNKDVDTSAMPFPVINSRSPVVKLIAELTQGVLVWDEVSKTAVEVKADILHGIVGAAPGKAPDLSNPTAPAPTETLLPTVTASTSHP